MSPVQGRSITGLESESAARTCLIAGPSVKHPRGSTREETFVFWIPALAVGNGIGGYGEDEHEDEEGEDGSEGQSRGGFIHSFIHSFIQFACVGWAKWLFILPQS